MTQFFFVRSGQTGETKRVNAEQIGTGDEWQAPCPFHKSESMTLKLNTEKAVWQCMSCQASGKVVTMDENRVSADSNEEDIDWLNPAREHIYRSESGDPLFKNVVYRLHSDSKKKKCILSAMVDGRWEIGLKKKGAKGNSIFESYKVHLVPYNLDKIIAHSNIPIYIHEGEKDCDTMDSVSRGEMIGTTNPMGAGKWKDEYSPYLKDRDVFLIPDNDKPGYDHMQQVGNRFERSLAL